MTEGSSTTAITLLGLLLPFAGLFIGAFFTRNQESAKYRKDRITEAYTAFVKIASDSSGPRSQEIARKQAFGEPLSEKEQAWPEEQHQRFVNAHSNILIYGSRRVVTALSNFYDASTVVDPEHQTAAFVELITAMREDSAAESYPEFSRHVDNILGAGPERRRRQMMEAAQMQQGHGA